MRTIKQVMVTVSILVLVHLITGCERSQDEFKQTGNERVQRRGPVVPKTDTVVEVPVIPVIPTTDIESADFYVATNGNDNNPGSLDQPFATWQKGFSAARPGDLVYIRGGIYHPVSTSAFGVYLDNKDGAAGNRIRIFAYPGEVPVMDMSTNTANTVGNYGIRLDNCDYLHLKGLHVKGASQHGLSHAASGIFINSCSHNIFEQLQAYNNQGSGIKLIYNSEDNLLLNCDSYDNYDPYTNGMAGGNSDGFDLAEIPYRAGNPRINTLRGCRAWYNSDDGYDLVSNGGHVYIDSCWAFNNGYIPQTSTASGNGCGFKLGQNDGNSDAVPMRTVTHCLAFFNRTHGYSQNESYLIMELYYNVAYANKLTGYFFTWNNVANIFRYNIVYENGNPYEYQSKTIHDHNNWDNGTVLTDSDFMSLDPTGVSGEREPNGSLPDLDFLKLY